MNLRSLLILSLLASGCAFDTDVDAAGANLTAVGETCRVSGAGELSTGDYASGLVQEDDTGATGSWEHISPVAGILLGTPDFVNCTINGINIGEFAGPAEVNGQPGYFYDVQVRDRGEPGPPVIVEGPPAVQTLTATRETRPTRWSDGVLSVTGDAARVTIPASLPVTEGAPGRGMAVLSFTDLDSGETLRCRYRGDGRRGRGGNQYRFRRCTGDGAEGLRAGDEVDVASMRLRVRNAAPCPERTTVEVDLTVRELSTQIISVDTYSISVFNPDTTLLFNVSDSVVSGDFTVVEFTP